MKLFKYAIFVAAARWSSFCDAQNLRKQNDSKEPYSADETPRSRQAEARSVNNNSPVNKNANKHADRRNPPETVDESPPGKGAQQLSDEGNALLQHERTLDASDPATYDLGVAGKKAVAHQKRQKLREYFQKRRSQMQVKATTVTDSGQIIDWINPTTQLPPGSTLAEPPDSPARRLDFADDEAGGDSLFELHRQLHARGPEGTVPVLRRDVVVSLLNDDQLPNSVEDFLSKYGNKNDSPLGHLGKHRSKKHAPKQNITREHHRQLQPGLQHKYASTEEDVSNFGGEAYINTWDTYVSQYGEFSLAQVAVVGGTTLQSVECGWQESQQIYGDSFPHLFTYFTTKEYTTYGDYEGGYNLDVAGFVQVSTKVFPGARITNLSKYGGRQYEMQVKVRLHEGNWWIWVFGEWIGYYPAQLYASQADGLLVGSQRIYWYGEIIDKTDGQPTSTWMGSGQFANKRKGYAAYMRNIITYRTDCNCSANYSPQYYTVTNSKCYSLAPFPNSRTSWRSYFYFGGPGAYNNVKCAQE